MTLSKSDQCATGPSQLGTGEMNMLRREEENGCGGGIAGIQLNAVAPAAEEAGWDAAKSIPGIGMVLNSAMTGKDLGQAALDYKFCMDGVESE